MERITGAHTDNARHSINLAGVWRFQPDASGCDDDFSASTRWWDERLARVNILQIAFPGGVPTAAGSSRSVQRVRRIRTSLAACSTGGLLHD